MTDDKHTCHFQLLENVCHWKCRCGKEKRCLLEHAVKEQAKRLYMTKTDRDKELEEAKKALNHTHRFLPSVGCKWKCDCGEERTACLCGKCLN